MYIWLINHYAVPPQYYPLARQTYFAKNLMAMGHKVTIISASTVHNSDLDLITDGSKWKREVVDGIDHVYIKCCHYKGNGLRRIYNMSEFAWKLPSVCKKLDKPDVIVATSMPPMSCAKGVEIAKNYGIPAIAEIADLWPESIVAYGIAKASNPIIICLRKLEKWIYKNADAIVFTMENAYQYIIDQGWQNEIPKSKVHYINNGIDLELFDYNKKHYQIDDEDLKNPDTFKVVYTGSIRRVNNLGRVLDAAKLVTNERVRFLIWGYGDELETLERRVREEEIRNVIFKGGVEKKYIPYIVSNSDLNLMHGGDVNHDKNENKTNLGKYGISPNKLFDYFASGKPVFTDFNDCYNPASNYDLGYIVKDDSSRGIAFEIDELAQLDSKELQRLGDNARKAASDYDFITLTKRLVEVIHSIEERSVQDN